MPKLKYGKLSRREGVSLHPKADKIMTKRAYPPGQHGLSRARKRSEYGVRLREKQKVRRMYGMSEAQFRKFFKSSAKLKGITGEDFLKRLELRLDNIVFRLRFAASRPQARQLVSHGHILVNGKKVDIPSYLVKVGDELSIKKTSMESPFFKNVQETINTENMPSWVKTDGKKLTGTVIAEPGREDFDKSINEQLIIEFYSR